MAIEARQEHRVSWVGDVPQPRRAVIACGRDGTAVRTERHAVHRADMAGQRGQRSWPVRVGDIGEASGAIRAGSSQQTSVRADRHTVGLPCSFAERSRRQHRGVTGGIEDGNNTVGVRTRAGPREQPAVRAERDCPDGFRGHGNGGGRRPDERCDHCEPGLGRGGQFPGSEAEPGGQCRVFRTLRVRRCGEPAGSVLGPVGGRPRCQHRGEGSRHQDEREQSGENRPPANSPPPPPCGQRRPGRQPIRCRCLGRWCLGCRGCRRGAGRRYSRRGL